MRGSALEALIRRSAQRQEGLGLHLTQTGARFIPSRAIGPGGRVEGTVTGTGDLDFVGSLGPLYVAIEAKSTRLPSRFPLALLKPHQVVLVKKAHARGALAFFLVELGAGSASPRYYVLPWPALAPWWEAWQRHEAGYGLDVPASIPAQVLDRDALSIPRGRQGLDLVRAIETLQSRIVA